MDEEQLLLLTVLSALSRRLMGKRNGVYELLVAAITNQPKPRGIKPQGFIISLYWQSQVQSGWAGLCSLLETFWRQSVSLSLSASGGTCIPWLVGHHHCTVTSFLPPSYPTLTGPLYTIRPAWVVQDHLSISGS